MQLVWQNKSGHIGLCCSESLANVHWAPEAQNKAHQIHKVRGVKLLLTSNLIWNMFFDGGVQVFHKANQSLTDHVHIDNRKLNAHAQQCVLERIKRY